MKMSEIKEIETEIEEKMKPLGTEHLEDTEYEPATETSLMFGAASEEEIQEAITKNAQLAETGFNVREDNPLGLTTNSIEVKSPLDGYTGPTTHIKIPDGWDSFGEAPIGVGQVKKEDIPDILKGIKQPKDEAQIWKERYYLLLAVVNSFHKN